MPDETPLHIPPTENVRERLARVTAESRLLRQLLKAAKTRDQVRLSIHPARQVASEGEAVPC